MIRRNGFQEYVIPMPTLALRFSAVKLLVDRSLINISRRLEGQGRESARIECDLPDFHQNLAPRAIFELGGSPKARHIRLRSLEAIAEWQ